MDLGVELMTEYEKKVIKEPHIFCHELPRRPALRDLRFAPTSGGELNPTDFASSFK